MAGKTTKNAHLWERHPDDWYVEERFATAELLKVEDFDAEGIWDPYCGRGHVLAEALAVGYPVFGSDLRTRKLVDGARAALFIEAPFESFLVSMAPGVIMNPPYRAGTGIEAAVRQARRYISVWKIAAFVPARFLWGKERALGFHQEQPASRVWLITPRPNAPPGPVWEEAPEEVGGGVEEFAWMVWERNAEWDWPKPGTYPELRQITGTRG